VQGSRCIDCDSLDSGEDEAFWRPIEAGSPPIWEETVIGKRQQAAHRVEPQMAENHKWHNLADGTVRGCARKP
jgi:hypothetical protein